MQDDDPIIPEAGYRQLVASVTSGEGRMCGIEGRRPDAENRYNVRAAYGDVPILIGHCAVFHRELLAHVFECESHFLKAFGWLPRIYGDDIFLSYCALNLYGRMNLAIKTRVDRLPDPHALSRHPNHLASRTKAMRCCQQLFCQ
jgi:hypothetical protein